MSSPTTTTTTPARTLDEQIADLVEQRDNLDAQLRALEAERAKRDDVMRYARSDPAFRRWQQRRQQQEERIR